MSVVSEYSSILTPERGFCLRGENCQYEHSDDVIIPTPEMMFGFPFPGAPQRGGFGGRGRGRGRGGMNMMPFPFPGPGGQMGPMGPGGPGMGMGGPSGGRGPRQGVDPGSEFFGVSRPPQDRNGNTLVITDIPTNHLTVPAIREYFARFGEVTNVAVEGRSKRALVSFTSNREAYQAWKSEDAVFGSRHVKVLWHKPRPGQGGSGQEALEKSAALVANLKAMQANGGNPQGDHKAVLVGPEQRLQNTLKELEAKDRRSKKEALFAEQKVLLVRAQKATQEEKITIVKRLKDIVKELGELDKPAPAVDVEVADKERLDAELAKHGMETTGSGDQEDLLRLSKQLNELRSKASALGVSSRYSPYARGGRGAAAAARGRGGRGRGGVVRGPMRLDNRTRAILVNGDALYTEEGRNAIRAYFESTGGSLEEVAGQGVQIKYPNREMAEKVLAAGTQEIPELAGKINATWYNAPAPVASSASTNEVEMLEEAQRGERDEDE